MYFWKSLPRTATQLQSVSCERARERARVGSEPALLRTFHQGGDGHQGVLLHAPRTSGALEHPQQGRHHHVGDLQRVLVLNLPQDVLSTQESVTAGGGPRA